LAEDTEDHRKLFGSRDGTARYFKTIPELVREARGLVSDATERRAMSDRLQMRMSTRNDSYAARLMTMLKLAGVDACAKVFD
jgi:hypothetical protein